MDCWDAPARACAAGKHHARACAAGCWRARLRATGISPPRPDASQECDRPAWQASVRPVRTHAPRGAGRCAGGRQACTSNIHEKQV